MVATTGSTSSRIPTPWSRLLTHPSQAGVAASTKPSRPTLLTVYMVSKPSSSLKTFSVKGLRHLAMIVWAYRISCLEALRLLSAGMEREIPALVKNATIGMRSTEMGAI